MAIPDYKKEIDLTELTKIINILGLENEDVKSDENLQSFVNNTMVKGFVRLVNKNPLNAALLIKEHLDEELLTTLKKNIQAYRLVQDTKFSKRENIIRESLGEDMKKIL